MIARRRRRTNLFTSSVKEKNHVVRERPSDVCLTIIIVIITIITYLCI